MISASHTPFFGYPDRVSGYSGTPLVKKLGFKPGHTVWIANPPDGFDGLLGSLPENLTLTDRTSKADIALVFAITRPEIEEAFAKAKDKIPANGAIWVAWPKRSSGVATDLTEDVMRDLFLPTGMVDNKVCAIDDTWSGLRFVVRKENRVNWAR